MQGGAFAGGIHQRKLVGVNKLRQKRHDMLLPLLAPFPQIIEPYISYQGLRSTEPR
jgi:hypothetical protein